MDYICSQDYCALLTFKLNGDGNTLFSLIHFDRRKTLLRETERRKILK